MTDSNFKPQEESPSMSIGIPTELDATSITLQTLERFEEDLADETGIWIFGYGSLCWNRGFNFEKSLIGFVRGFSRKFWQGNTTHRGTQNKPGRVATLIRENEGIVWGQAFQVKEKKAFSYLNNRECELGGYLTTITTFYPRKDAKEDKRIKPFPVILYLATPSNSLWLGDSPLGEMAKQIVECTGSSGHNVEYLLKLAIFVRENIPEAIDEHLFALECLVRSEIIQRKMCLKTLMGEKKICTTENGEAGKAKVRNQEQDLEGSGTDRTNNFQFTSTITSKTPFCANI